MNRCTKSILRGALPSLKQRYLSTGLPRQVQLEEYIRSIKDTLIPPVSNKLLFSSGQLKVMIVGGPNQRDDFHIERGEELFYQLKGGMDLDIFEDGTRKRVHIAEGRMLLLPAGVPHSPQRYADTIGIVIERDRLENELDCLRWYVPGQNKILHESFFHCTDLGTQLKEAIDAYNKMTAAIPPGTKQDGVPDYNPFDTPVVKSDNFPNIHLARRIRSTLETVEAEAVLRLKDAKSVSITEPTVAPVIPPFSLLHGEFRVDLFHGQTNSSLPCPQYGEVFLWQQVGFSEVSVHHASKGPNSKPTPIPLKVGEVVLLSAKDGPQTIRVRQLERGSCTLCVYNTTIKQP